MAYSSASISVANALPEDTRLTQNAANVSGLLTNADQTAVAAAVATLVADGVSPTQAHVTALNSAWGTLITNSTAQGDAVLLVNPANVTSNTILGRILAQFTRIFLGGLGGLTA